MKRRIHQQQTTQKPGLLGDSWWNMANAVFPMLGLQVWNSLLHAIQEITDSNIFKRKLKTFLFEHARSTLAAGHVRCKRWIVLNWIELNSLLCSFMNVYSVGLFYMISCSFRLYLVHAMKTVHMWALLTSASVAYLRAKIFWRLNVVSKGIIVIWFSEKSLIPFRLGICPRPRWETYSAPQTPSWI